MKAATRRPFCLFFKASFLKRSLVSIGVCFSSCSLAAAADGSGLAVGVAVDLLGSFNLDRGHEASDALNPREVELSLTAPVDSKFEGVLSLAAHREHGQYLCELHEATLSSSKLLPRSQLRLGQFFLGVGRLNQVHRHDWLFISAPKVHEEFFGSEGVLDSGGEYSYLLPTALYVNLTLGATNGWVYGHSHCGGEHDHSHCGGEKPRTPTHYARLGTFFDVKEDMGLALGLNVLSRTAADGTRMQLLGLDAVSKYSPGSFSPFLLQAEAWQRRVSSATGSQELALGAYLYPQLGFSSAYFAGLRLDYFTQASLKDAKGKQLANYDIDVVPTFTYKSSEFASFKLAYNHKTAYQEHQDAKNHQVLELQSTFILGAHPAHAF